MENQRIPYSGFILQEKIFANFVDLFQFVKLLFANIACTCRVLQCSFQIQRPARNRISGWPAPYVCNVFATTGKNQGTRYFQVALWQISGETPSTGYFAEDSTAFAKKQAANCRQCMMNMSNYHISFHNSDSIRLLPSFRQGSNCPTEASQMSL